MIPNWAVPRSLLADGRDLEPAKGTRVGPYSSNFSRPGTAFTDVNAIH